ncbi:hypothetical protein GH733_013310, partial [Mirounga leonina]
MHLLKMQNQSHGCDFFQDVQKPTQDAWEPLTRGVGGAHQEDGNHLTNSAGWRPKGWGLFHNILADIIFFRKIEKFVDSASSFGPQISSNFCGHTLLIKSMKFMFIIYFIGVWRRGLEGKERAGSRPPAFPRAPLGKGEGFLPRQPSATFCKQQEPGQLQSVSPGAAILTSMGIRITTLKFPVQAKLWSLRRNVSPEALSSTPHPRRSSPPVVVAVLSHTPSSDPFGDQQEMLARQLAGIKHLEFFKLSLVAFHSVKKEDRVFGIISLPLSALVIALLRLEEISCVQLTVPPSVPGAAVDPRNLQVRSADQGRWRRRLVGPGLAAQGRSDGDRASCWVAAAPAGVRRCDNFKEDIFLDKWSHSIMDYHNFWLREFR